MTRKEIRKLDDEFKRMVREGKPCSRCGTSRMVQASHVIPVSTCGYILRWSFENCIPLCYSCHLHWWHKNPLEAYDWFKKTFGVKRYNALKILQLKSGKYLTPQQVRDSWKGERNDGG